MFDTSCPISVWLASAVPERFLLSDCFIMVPLAGLKPNEQLRFERLEAVWNQARRGICDNKASSGKDDFEVVAEPSRPPRTPPTPEEVDAIRTAKASGESVRSIAERFGKHRSTVWRYTKGHSIGWPARIRIT